MENKVRQLRKDHGLTQKDLADRVNVSSRTIISLENEKYNPSLQLAYKIARVFDRPIEEVFIFSEKDLLD